MTAWGTRGDVEPCLAVGLELERRGHDVVLGVAPDLVDFVTSAGLAAVAHGPECAPRLKDERLHFQRVQNPLAVVRRCREIIAEDYVQLSAAVKELAQDADLLVTATNYQEIATNVAEYYDIPLAAFHWAPTRVSGYALPKFPPALNRLLTRAGLQVYWQFFRGADAAQRAELGLAPTKAQAAQRIAERGGLEIQAYERFFFPGLAAEWRAKPRPFVGSITMQQPTTGDDDVMSWVRAGTPPIYFGFGSTPVKTPAETIDMIGAVCSELGERALINSSGIAGLAHPPHVKLVESMNFSMVFPHCRAVVHHGGTGTTAAGLRAGMPTLILWTSAEQPVWAGQVDLFKVGSGRRLAGINARKLVRELRTILKPEYALRAAELAPRMTHPQEAVHTTADLLEDLSRRAAPRTAHRLVDENRQ